MRKFERISEKIRNASAPARPLASHSAKVGSNYFLEDKRISFSPNSPHDLLASPAFDASKTTLTHYLCREGDSNPQGSLHTHLKRTRLPFRHLGNFSQKFFTVSGF